MLSTKAKALSLVAGLVFGGIYGTVSSSKANMQAFSALGPDYQLGRIPMQEELQWASEDQIAESQGLAK